MQLDLPTELRTPESLRTFIDLMPYGLLILDRERRVQLGNDRAATIFRYESGELPGLPLVSLLPEGDPSAAGLLEHDQPGVRKDGSSFVARVAVKSASTADFQIVLCVVEDVTDRRRRDTMLGRLAEAVVHTTDAVAITDAGGAVQYVNPSFERMSGRSMAEIVGMLPRTLRNDHPEAVEIWASLRDGRTWEGRAELPGVGGGLQTVDVSISPILDEASKLTGIVEIRRDRTEAESLQDQLFHSQKLEAVGQLAAGIAHEINTPIQFIGDNLRFLGDGIDDVAGLAKRLREALGHHRAGTLSDEFVEQAEAAISAADLDFLLAEVPSAIQQSLEGVDRVADIVRAMKEYSHPSDERVATDLNAAIQSTVTVARAEWKYLADVVTDFDPDLPPIVCSAGEFNQVILNMLVNAAHAISEVIDEGADEKGTITIVTRRDGDGARITIEDTGTGMPPEVRARVFDPFFTTKDVGRGTGQGLSLAHTIIVKHHGGTLDVTSEPGGGTTFSIRLPRGVEDEETAS